MKLADLAHIGRLVRPSDPIRKIRRALRRRFARRQGWKLLAKIESHRGPLPAGLKRQCDDYSREILGDVGHAPWLYAYAACQRQFREGWIPRSYYMEHVLPDAYTAGRLCHDRHLTRKVLQTDLLPDVAYVIGGKLYDTAFHRIDAQDARQLIFREPTDILFKINRAPSGRGVCKVTREELFHINFKTLPDGVFQTRVTPHPAFDKLLPEHGPTMRLTTVVGVDGKAEIRAAHLRVSRDHTDFVKPSDSVNVSIDLTTGRLDSEGFLTTNLQPTPIHPDTGFNFAGHPMPRFHDAVAQVLALHDSCPLGKIVGWDVCIDFEDRIQIFEWNLYAPEIRFLEATSGPHFRGLGWENLWRQNRR